MKTIQKIGCIIAALILTGMFFVPETIGLSVSGIRTLGVLLAVIVLLVTEPFPLGVVCLLSVALLTFTGAVPNVSAALSGFTNHILFFVLVSFAISAAFTKGTLSKRLLLRFVNLFGKKIDPLLLALLFSAALLSSIMSNVATTALFIGMTKDLISAYPTEEERRRSGRTFMIGLPIACIIGGMMTPAGNPINLIVIDALANTGIRLTFVQWMAIGVPIALVSLLLLWLLLKKIYPPAPLPEENLDAYLTSFDVPDRMNGKEKYVCTVLFVTILLWIAGSWIAELNITVVGIFSFFFLLLPKYGVLSWEDFISHVSWPAFFLIGSMVTFGNALTASGVGQWFVKTCFPAVLPHSQTLVVFLLAASVSLLLVAIPITPALVTMLTAPFLAMASSWNISPVLPLMTLILCAVNSLHLPLDTVPLMTYMTGYYKAGEMTRIGVVLELIFDVLLALWLPFIAGLLGF